MMSTNKDKSHTEHTNTIRTSGTPSNSGLFSACAPSHGIYGIGRLIGKPTTTTTNTSKRRHGGGSVGGGS